MSSAETEKRLCVGIVTGPQGIRGAVRVKSFTADPLAIGAYGAVTDERGIRVFTLKAVAQVKGTVIAELSGVADRNAAEALKGLRLYVRRDQLPPAEAEEFYHADLIGLAAELVSGEVLGKVGAVYDFGAGDALEILTAEGAVVMVPFTKAAVPVIDVAGGRIVVDPPAGLLEKPAPPAPLEDQVAALADVGEAHP
jgi:16S rRNA processing protein RimM